MEVGRKGRRTCFIITRYVSYLPFEWCWERISLLIPSFRCESPPADAKLLSVFVCIRILPTPFGPRRFFWKAARRSGTQYKGWPPEVSGEGLKVGHWPNGGLYSAPYLWNVSHRKLRSNSRPESTCFSSFLSFQLVRNLQLVPSASAELTNDSRIKAKIQLW